MLGTPFFSSGRNEGGLAVGGWSVEESIDIAEAFLLGSDFDVFLEMSSRLNSS